MTYDPDVHEASVMRKLSDRNHVDEIPDVLDMAVYPLMEDLQIAALGVGIEPDWKTLKIKIFSGDDGHVWVSATVNEIST